MALLKYHNSSVVKSQKPFLIIAALACLVALVVMYIVIVKHPAPPVPQIQVSEEPLVLSGSQTSQLFIMNVLNRFLIQDSGTASKSATQRQEQRAPYVDEMITSLHTIPENDPLTALRNALAPVLTQWHRELTAHSSTDDIRGQLLQIGDENPWMQMLIRLIVVSHL